jgi:NitT/TauT family transport system substrate-binding protein
MTEKLLAALFGLVVAFGLASVDALAQSESKTMKIQDYPGVGNMLVRVAISKGYCDRHGIKCELSMIPNAPLGAQALLAKNIDVAVLAPEVQMSAIIKGAKIRAVAGAFSLVPVSLVIRNELPTPNVGKGYPAFMQDLVGKKIGVPVRGGAGEFQFVAMLQNAGYSADNVSFVAVGAPNTGYPALISGQVDAVWSFEPTGTMCEFLNTCREIWRAATAPEPKEITAMNGAGVLFVFRQDDIDQKPDVVEAFVETARDAEAFMQNAANFDDVAKIANNYFKFDLPNGEGLMTATLRRGLPGYKVSISRPALKAAADYMYETKQITAPFDYTTLIYDKAP